MTSHKIFKCEWKDCILKFESEESLRRHLDDHLKHNQDNHNQVNHDEEDDHDDHDDREVQDDEHHVIEEPIETVEISTHVDDGEVQDQVLNSEVSH